MQKAKVNDECWVHHLCSCASGIFEESEKYLLVEDNNNLFCPPSCLESLTSYVSPFSGYWALVSGEQADEQEICLQLPTETSDPLPTLSNFNHLVPICVFLNLYLCISEFVYAYFWICICVFLNLYLCICVPMIHSLHTQTSTTSRQL